MDKDLEETVAGRHKAVQDAARGFEYDHLPAGKPRYLSAMCAAMAVQMISELPDDPELTHGLRRLLEAKDCFVRAAVFSVPQDITASGGINLHLGAGNQVQEVGEEDGR
jgi:hypothetical protein